MRSVVDWLPTGHDHELARLESIAEEAANGSEVRGAVIRGPLGSGTTTVMGRVAARLADRGWATVRLSAANGRFAAPLAWLAPLRGPGLDRSDRVSLVHELRALLRRRGGTAPLLLMVDDAHLLDRADRFVLERLAVDGDIVLVATMTTERGPDRAFAIAMHERLLEPIDVGPCTAADLARAAAGLLGAPLDEQLTEHLVRRSGGSPLFARELLLADVARASVASDGRRWGFVAPPAQDVSLPRLLSDRVRALPPAGRSLLEVLALTGPLPDVPEIRRGLDNHEVSALVEAGLLAPAIVSSDGAVNGTTARRATTRMLTLAHPLLGEVIVSGWTEQSRDQVAGRAVQALSALPDADPDRSIRIARLASACGLAVDDDILLRAARRSLRQLDAALAEQLLTAVGAATWDGWFLLGHARAAQGHMDGADRALANAVAIADTDERRARAASRRSNNLVIGALRVDEAISVLDDASSSVSDPRWKRFLEIERTHPPLSCGRPAGIGSRDSGHAATRVSVEVVIDAVSAASSGRGDACEALVTAGLDTAHLVRHQTPDVREHLVLTRWLWLTVAGRAAESRATIRAELDRAAPGDPHVAPWLVARAVERLLDGDLRRAADEADRATEAFATLDLHGLGRIAAALGALIDARVGHRDVTNLHLDVAAAPIVDGVGDVIGDVVDVLGRLTRAWVEAAHDRRHRGAELAAGAARLATERGGPGLAVFCAHDAAWLGRPDLALAAIDALERLPDGRLSRVIRDHAVALVDRDDAALLRLAEEFPGLGCTASGAQAALAAADISHAAGRASDALRARSRAGELLADLGPGRAPLPGSKATLTPLERRLAELVARRQPLARIATELELPLGVVQELLDTVQDKLGVSNRRALEAHVAVLGSPPAPGRRDRATLADTGP